jgi:hypothetical protein
MPKLLSILVDVQDIYVDKIYPNFYNFFLPRSAPLGVSTRILRILLVTGLVTHIWLTIWLA